MSDSKDSTQSESKDSPQGNSTISPQSDSKVCEADYSDQADEKDLASKTEDKGPA